MRIIVTGALGHIGSALVRYLPLELPYAHIIMIDNLYTQRYCSLFNLPKASYEFIENDARICKLPPHDIVVHLAAYTEPHAQLDWKHNIDATYNIASQANRLIFPSTLSVLPEPQTPYAGAKLKEEGLVGPYGTICRLGNLCGPSVGMRFHTVVNKLCWQAVHKQPLTVWKTALEQRRPYLEVRDTVRAICFLIKYPQAGVFNLVSETATIADVISCIRKQLPVTINLVDSPSMNNVQQDQAASMPVGFNFIGGLDSAIANTLTLLMHG